MSIKKQKREDLEKSKVDKEIEAEQPEEEAEQTEIEPEKTEETPEVKEESKSKSKKKTEEELTEEQIKEQIKEPEKEEFAPAEHIMILELTEDGRAKFIPATWAGKSDVLVDEYTKRTYMLTTEKGDTPPFFDIPFQVAKNPIALLFWRLARVFGLKTVWHRALLYPPKCLLPFNWKEQKQDVLSGRVWNATVEDAARALAKQQIAKGAMSNSIMYVLIGFVVILCIIILATLAGG
ncbi:MAG: hypothetical protein SVE93_00505 [Candidatus Thermoplasmatota archaeon]|nr:hypothetical protein [Candidatus Thermoplasmatota archaeon]